MATISSQRVFPTGDGANIVATVVTLTAASDSVTLPRMSAASNMVVQLIRPGDSTCTVSQSTASVVNLTGNVGQSILLISHSDDPIPSPTGDGA